MRVATRTEPKFVDWDNNHEPVEFEGQDNPLSENERVAIVEYITGRLQYATYPCVDTNGKVPGDFATWLVRWRPELNDFCVERTTWTRSWRCVSTLDILRQLRRYYEEGEIRGGW